jgi:hypothetical protein
MSFDVEQNIYSWKVFLSNGNVETSPRVQGLKRPESEADVLYSSIAEVKN